MKDQKNIERLFQEKFKDFEATPPKASWDNIASRLNEKKKKRRVIPVWFQLSGIAASLFIIGTIVWNFQSTENTTPNFESNETVVGVDNNVNDNGISNTNSTVDSNEGFNNSETNPNIATDKQTNASRNENSKFDSKLIPSKSTSTSVVSNGDKNIRSNTQNNNNNYPENNSTSGMKKKTKRFNKINSNEVNGAIVTNSKTGKTKRSKDTKRNQSFDTDLILDSKDNTTNNLVINNTSNKSSLNESINTDKINTLFNKTETDNNYVNNTNDALSNTTIDTTNSVVVASSENIMPKDSTLVAEISPEINPLEELLAEKEAGKNEDEKEKEKRSRWAVSTNASPVYFNSVAEGSSLDSRFNANEKEYNNTLSYGVGVNYAINNKLTFKTGINNLSLDYNTSDISFYQAATTKPIENVTTNARGKMINVESKLEDNGTFITVSGNPLTKFDGAINQQISYVEVPLELGYKLLDRKFGIEVIGGFSTLFLNNNSVSIVSNGQEMTIGEANNLNNIHFSSNVGLGFKYSFWNSFNANFQPMFKYQINTFSENSGNFKPYFIGLYTGVSFSF